MLDQCPSAAVAGLDPEPPHPTGRELIGSMGISIIKNAKNGRSGCDRLAKPVKELAVHRGRALAIGRDSLPQVDPGDE